MLPFCFVLSCSQLLLFPKNPGHRLCKTEFPNWALSHFLKCSTCCPMLLPSCFQKVSVHGSCKNSFQIEPHSIFSIAGRAAPFLFLKIQIYRFCSTKFHTWRLLIFYHDAWCAAPFLFPKQILMVFKWISFQNWCTFLLLSACAEVIQKKCQSFFSFVLELFGCWMLDASTLRDF